MRDTVKKYGPSIIYTIQDPIFKNHLNTPLLKALTVAMDKVNPKLMAFASTESTKDVLGALAANRKAAALPDVSSFELTDSGVKAVRPVMASKINSEVSAEGEPVLVSVRAGSYDVQEKETDTTIETIGFGFDESELRITLREIITSSSERLTWLKPKPLLQPAEALKMKKHRNWLQNWPPY